MAKKTPRAPWRSHYPGKRDIHPGLPRDSRSWELCKGHAMGKDWQDHVSVAQALHRSLKEHKWSWPKRPVFFLTDPHADADAFRASLVATGGVRVRRADKTSFKLTGEGRKAHFIIGGDCLDKGPSSLELLSTLKGFMDTGARVTLLAGNHDLRLMLGLATLDLDADIRTEHFFLRMGPKVVPLLTEIYQHYLQAGKNPLKDVPNERKCRQLLYPSKRWFHEFPKVAGWLMPDDAVAREVERLRKKQDLFSDSCKQAGLSMRMVYAAALHCRHLFIDRSGQYAWFYRGMRLLHRDGSFLFVHAGFDDRIARRLQHQGVAAVNRLFWRQLRMDPFEFYYGPLANMIRTKYRKSDMPLTQKGVQRLHGMGIYAVVHGHNNRRQGQRIVSRRGMLHIECDVTLDRNSRKKEGLKGYGAGATIIRPGGPVIGISNDYPEAKVFQPEAFLKKYSEQQR